MPENPEGETTPAETPEKPQEPAKEPVTPEPTKETAPPTPTPQTPVQGDDATAKAVAEAETAKAKATQLELELNRERAARKYSVPDALIGLLRADSVEADARAIADMLAARNTSLGTGGLDPTDASDPTAEGEALADRIFSTHRFL